jgi:hypothetical protein
MNPFRENPEVLQISDRFYEKYYADNKPRRLILGINPGRLGAGSTGIPFTDSKRLKEHCQIEIESVKSHEPSSVFIYQVIETFGGPARFYEEFYINSVCPLGFLHRNNRGNWVNCNYYDYPKLIEAVKPFCIDQLKKQLAFGFDRSVVYLLGKKNGQLFERWNAVYQLFEKVEILPHPRYIVQYRSKYTAAYLKEYLSTVKTSA